MNKHIYIHTTKLIKKHYLLLVENTYSLAHAFKERARR